MKTRLMTLVLVLLSIPIFAQIQSIQVTDNVSHLNVTINGNTRSIPKRDLNLQYVDPNITLSMNGTRIFKIDNHALVTVPTSTSIVDLNNKLIALLQEDTGGGPETDPTVIPEVKSLTSADVASFKAAATATSNGSFLTRTGNVTESVTGAKTFSAFTSFSSGINVGVINRNATASPLVIQQSNASTVIAQFHGNTGGLHLQAPGTAPTPTTNQLAVDGTTLLNGSVNHSAEILPTVGSSQNIGSAALRYLGIYSNNFLGSGTTYFGGGSTTSSAYFRQGSISQVVGGFHPSGGGGFAQSPGVVPATNGFTWTVYGDQLTTGQIRTQGNLVQSNTGSYYSYNTSDETTNWERGYQRWNGNVYEVGSERNGTGAIRAARFGIKGSTDISFNVNPSGTRFDFTSNGGAYNSPVYYNVGGINFTSTNAVQTAHAIVPNTQQTGTAGYNMFYASVYEQSVGSGLKYLINLGTNSAANGSGTHSEKFTVSNTGVTTATQYNVSSLNTAPASATATGTTGEVRYTATHIYVCIATNTWVRAALTTF